MAGEHRRPAQSGDRYAGAKGAQAADRYGAHDDLADDAGGIAVLFQQTVRRLGGHQFSQGGTGRHPAVRLACGVCHPDDQAGVKAVFQKSFARGEPLQHKGRLCRKDGEYRWIDSRLEPLRDEGATIPRWYGVNFDIDDEVRAQESLRLPDERLARALRGRQRRSSPGPHDSTGLVIRADAGDACDIGLVRWRVRSDSLSTQRQGQCHASKAIAPRLHRRVGLDHHKASLCQRVELFDVHQSPPRSPYLPVDLTFRMSSGLCRPYRRRTRQAIEQARWCWHFR
ncbi:PAS domain-containing protein [Mesorhizobium sp. M0847]